VPSCVQPEVERRPSDDLEVERMYAQVRGALFRRPPEPVQLGRYEILDKIGAGGMGMVYAGRDPQLGRAVALKLIRPGRLADGGNLEAAQQRLLREARAMARVSSPFVVTVYEAGTHGQQVFVAMELVDGLTLTRWLSTRRSWKEVVGIFIQAGRGLVAVHDAGLVHRDFKPDNVLIGADGRARVADFGLAAVDGDGAGREGSAPATGTALTLTRTGAIMGSLAYMSPEQHRRETVDARSDQFAFCVALFEGLVGHRPFGGDTAEGLRRDVLTGAVDWREASKLPDRILRLLRRGLSLEPSKRWSSMAEVVEQLDRALHPTRRWIYLGAAASLILGSGLATSLLVEREPLCDRAAGEAERAWGSARREAVSAALRATDRDFSARTAQQVTERLDAHAEAWTNAHASVCEGAEDRETRDAVLLQVACLDRIALETEALTRALAEAPERFVEHATLAVYKLREPTRCLESSQPWVGLGVGLGVRSDAGPDPMPIFVALARAEARLNAADDEGIEDAAAALELARSLGEPTYEAEALLLRGMFWTRVGRWSEAELDLVAANDVAEQYGAWEVAVRARTELVFVVGFRQRRFGEARVWSGLAQSALERAGAGGLVEVRLLNAQGLVLAEQDRAATARVSLEQALELARASLDPNHPGLAATLENLGRLELLEGRRDEARAQVLEAYRIRESTLGASHPDTVRTKELLALVQG